jgi:hypothetical protein
MKALHLHMQALQWSCCGRPRNFNADEGSPVRGFGSSSSLLFLGSQEIGHADVHEHVVFNGCRPTVAVKNNTDGTCGSKTGFTIERKLNPPIRRMSYVACRA